MGGEIGIEDAPAMPGKDSGGSIFWFTVPSIVVEAAPPNHALQGVNVAVVSPNRILSQGLNTQLREAGGNVVGATVAQGMAQAAPTPQAVAASQSAPRARRPASPSCWPRTIPST
jgi:hypothetical protein